MGNRKSTIDKRDDPKWYEIEEAMHEANLAERYAMLTPKFRSVNRPPPLKSVVLFKEFTPDNDKQTTSEASTIIEVALLKINESTAGDGVEPDISFKVVGNRKEIHIRGSIADVNELRRVANGLRWIEEKKTQFNRTVSNSASKPPKPSKPSKHIGPRRSLIWDEFGSVPVKKSPFYRPVDALKKLAESQRDAAIAEVEARLNAVAAEGLYQGAPPSSIEPSAVTFIPYGSAKMSNRDLTKQINELLEAISKDPKNPDNYEQLAALSRGIESYYKNENGKNMTQDDLIEHASSLRTAAAGGAGKAGGARRTKKRRGYKKRPGNHSRNRSDNRNRNRNRNQKLTIS
jgi:hypothetical protein